MCDPKNVPTVPEQLLQSFKLRSGQTIPYWAFKIEETEHSRSRGYVSLHDLFKGINNNQFVEYIL